MRRGWGVELLVPRREHRQPLAPLHARTAAAGTPAPWHATAGTAGAFRLWQQLCPRARNQDGAARAPIPAACCTSRRASAPRSGRRPRCRQRCHAAARCAAIPPHNVPPPLPRSSRRGPNAKLMLFIVLMAGAVLFSVAMFSSGSAAARALDLDIRVQVQAGSSSGAPT